jgi:hypothetical protein
MMSAAGGGGGGGGSSASVSQQQQEQQSVLDWKFSQVFGERAAGEEVQEGKEPLQATCVCVFFFSVKEHSSVLVDYGEQQASQSN